MEFVLKHKTLLIVIAIIIFSLVSIIFLRQSRIFTRRNVIRAETSVKSYGNLSVFIIILLILISTLIPPLPIPIPLVEIVSGLIFGFLTGFLISFFAQIIASSLAFWCARVLGRKYFRKVFQNKIFNKYKQYINGHGAKAVLMLRASIGSPFNMVSFLSGLTEMDFKSFFLATFIGCLPEVILFSFLGASLQSTRIRLSYVFIFVILVGAIGMISTIYIVKKKS